MTMEGCQSTHICIINGSLIIIIHKTSLLALSREMRPSVELSKKEPPQNKGFFSREPLWTGLCVDGSEGGWAKRGGGRLGAAWVSRAETQSLPASAPIRAPRRWRRLTSTSYPIVISSTPSLTSSNPKLQPQIYCLDPSFNVANDVPRSTLLLHWCFS